MTITPTTTPNATTPTRSPDRHSLRYMLHGAQLHDLPGAITPGEAVLERRLIVVVTPSEDAPRVLAEIERRDGPPSPETVSVRWYLCDAPTLREAQLAEVATRQATKAAQRLAQEVNVAAYPGEASFETPPANPSS